MKTIAIDDELYAALEKQSEIDETSVDDLAAEAIAIWLFEVEMDQIESEITEGGHRILEQGDDGYEELFQFAKNRWMQEGLLDVDIDDLKAHLDSQGVLTMGQMTIDLILQELEANPDFHWFFALRAITGANPVPQDARGDLSKMTQAWLDWGRENGYLGQSDGG